MAEEVKPVWGQCSHEICRHIREKRGMLPSNVSIVVHDGNSVIACVYGLGHNYGLFGTCSGHYENGDTCWISTAQRELEEEYKISITPEHFESRIETIVLISNHPTILFNFRGFDLHALRDEVFADHLYARNVLGLRTIYQCRHCRKTKDETPEQSRIASNGEMSDLVMINIFDIYYLEFNDCSRNAIHYAFTGSGLQVPYRPRHLRKYDYSTVRIW
jgi:8-oxo-dGTP pyrophosphatase MutT (NUDIX family)